MEKRITPFNIKYWLSKGLSKEDAQFKINSFRKWEKEYWISRGFSIEDSKLNSEKFKSDRSKKERKKQPLIETECCKCHKKISKGSNSIRNKNFCDDCHGSVILICPVCKNEFNKWKSQLMSYGQKPQNIFCSMKCKALSQRKDWNKLSRKSLKQRYIKEFGEESMYCRRCGYNKNLYNINLHHKVYVINGGDNDPDNLEPLCLNCHGDEHYEIKDKYER